jgi:pimeloyl-ACP methyl ester carboxylesterase
MYFADKNHAMNLIKLSIFVLILTSCIPEGYQGRTEGTIPSEDHTEISYTSYGDAEIALVFVHCWCCDQDYWREQVDTFISDYRVVTIDLAGHGRSGTGRDNYTLQAFGNDVASVVEHLELDRIILIGHSMGGSVILAAAQKLKEQTIALIGVDTYQRFRYGFADTMVKQFIQPFRTDFYHTTIGYVQGLFPPGADPSMVMEIAEDMAVGPEEVAVSAMINNFSTDPADLLKGLDVPLYSINSTMFPVEVDDNRKLYADYEVRFMEGVGHFIQLEDPGTFNKMLKDILQEII